MQEQQRIVNFKALMEDGIVQDTFATRESSYSSAEYQRADEIIRTIIEQNKNYHASSENAYILRKREIFNVIPFIGERGSGKTSTMCSFASMLKNHGAEKQIGELSSDVRFIVLDAIDASVLKEHENILLIILSRMVKYLKTQTESLQKGNAIRNEELRKLYMEFGGICGDLQAANEKPFSGDKSQMLQQLLNLSSSHSLAERFYKLTQSFLDYIRDMVDNNNLNEYYLVIALDDIDLYYHKGKGGVKSAYTLLEQVYEYLQIPGVVVLATYNDRRLRENCRNYVEEKFMFHDPEQQVSAFLDKVVLPVYKIYMPVINVKDYGRELELLIQIDDFEGKEGKN